MEEKMKGIIKIISLSICLIMLFSAGLLAGTYAIAKAPAAAKDYEVDRFTDESLFVKKESGPAKQSDMKEKFDDYVTLEDDTLTFFTKEQAEALHERKENGEIFTLTYDEVLFIINDSIQQYFNHDNIILTNATIYGLIPKGKIQRSWNHHVYCYHDDLSKLPYNSAVSTYNEMLDNIYCIIVYRLYMLDSTFVTCEQYLTDDLSRWLIVDGQTPGVLVSGKGEYGLESINVDPPIPEKAFCLKSFAKSDNKQEAVSEYSVYLNKTKASVSSKISEENEKWMNTSLKAPLLIVDYNDKDGMITVCGSDGLTLSAVYPTAELKDRAPVYDPDKEFNNEYDRSIAESIAENLLPDYDLSLQTPAYPLKYYMEGCGDVGRLEEGMKFSEIVEQFGLPYNGVTSGLFTFRYFTEEGKVIVLYCNPRCFAETKLVDDFTIDRIIWPE